MSAIQEFLALSDDDQEFLINKYNKKHNVIDYDFLVFAHNYSKSSTDNHDDYLEEIHLKELVV